MKRIRAYIVINDRTGQPFCIDEQVKIFWLKKVALDWVESKWGGISVRRVEIKEISNKVKSNSR